MTRQNSIDLNVLFLSGEARELDGSRIYRCDYQAKQIRRSGGEARVEFVGSYSPRSLAAADVVVFSRCLWGADALQAVKHARSLGKVICGDLDDKIYSPWEAGGTGFSRTKALQGRRLEAEAHVREAQRNVLRLLPLFDRVLVSTPSIVEDLERLGIPAHLSRNAIDTDERAPIARQRAGLKRILFMTGTRTHDADFRLALPAVHRFLGENPQLQLTMLGPVGVPPELLALPNVRVVQKLALKELDPFVAEHDVCLVPLEATRFNDCKSALKFLECGLVSVPVIASPRHEFAEIIQHGQNGMLADSGRDWYDALQQLKGTSGLLGRAAARAHQDVLEGHTVVSRGARLAEYIDGLLDAGPVKSLVTLAQSLPRISP